MPFYMLFFILFAFVTGDVAVNCGSTGNSGEFDGRKWVGDAAGSELVPKGKPESSTAVDRSNPVPYKTSTISASPFYYELPVTPGQKFIRLHFFPAFYRGFRDFEDRFTVKAGPFTLLNEFSASLAADALGVKFFVKEFCLNIEQNAVLIISFSPSTISPSRNTVAFVNGIEIISMPTGLYYTKDSDLGARIVGLHNRFAVIDNSTALALIERLNIGASSTVTSMDDFGLFRRWNGDSDFLMDAGFLQAIHPADKIMYPRSHAYLAPPEVYQTSWQMKPTASVQGLYALQWKIAVDVGFEYLVRLHFCDSDPRMSGEKKELDIHMIDHIGERKVDSVNSSGHGTTPFYRDYMVRMKGDKDGGKCDLLISLRSSDHFAVGVLNGLEVFKLSNLENSLATPNLVLPRSMPSSWKPKLFIFTQINTLATGITFLLVLVNVIVWNLSQNCEASSHKEKGTLWQSYDASSCCFSLHEIKLATQNFSDAAVIGRGGFGKVYKGFITSISKIAAIKRLKADSKQGSREFWTEVETLTKFRHIHLVSLIGYCNESSEMILVYEYMPRGTLADNIYKFAEDGKDDVLLSWEQRLRICIGAARGLEYLHTGVIHRDVKDTNILLDENFVAKISDFGLSRLEKLSESKSYMITKVWGTPYYIDPEYRRTEKLTRMVDVYAFGVVLLVVLSGRPAVDARNPEQVLLSRFMKCVAERDFIGIVDPKLGGSILSNSLKEFVGSIKSCLHHQPEKRPTMAQVAARLELALVKQERSSYPETVDVAEMSQLYEDGSMNSMQFSQMPSSSPIQSPPLPSKAKEPQLREVEKPAWGLSWIARKRGKAKKETGEELQDPGYLFSTPRPGPRFSLKDLRLGTNSFEGGSLTVDAGGCEVWSGYMKQVQKPVAIYKDRCFGLFNISLHFKIDKLCKLRHVNLHSLIGHCIGEVYDVSFIVYEHVGFESLHSRIYHSGTEYAPLSWKCRLNICIGVAEGLVYLQQCTGRAKNHSNLRLEYILLDENCIPKISHFGYAGFKFLAEDQQKVKRSTPSNTLPGFEIRGDSDMFFLGLLLVEVLLSRRIDFEEFAAFVVAMQKNINDRTFHLTFDPTLKGEIATECFAEYLKAIFSSTIASKLPASVAGVASTLKSALALQEKAEAAKQADGDDATFNIEDIYRDISQLDVFLNNLEFKLL